MISLDVKICKYLCYWCEALLICDCTGSTGCGYNTVGLFDRRCLTAGPHCHYPKFCVGCYEAIYAPLEGGRKTKFSAHGSPLAEVEAAPGGEPLVMC